MSVRRRRIVAWAVLVKAWTCHSHLLRKDSKVRIRMKWQVRRQTQSLIHPRTRSLIQRKKECTVNRPNIRNHFTSRPMIPLMQTVKQIKKSMWSSHWLVSRWWMAQEDKEFVLPYQRKSAQRKTSIQFSRGKQVRNLIIVSQNLHLPPKLATHLKILTKPIRTRFWFYLTSVSIGGHTSLLLLMAMGWTVNLSANMLKPLLQNKLNNQSNTHSIRPRSTNESLIRLK